MQVLKSGNVQLAQLGLQHYAAHWSQGVNKKTIPKDQINSEKAAIAAMEEMIKVQTEKQQLAQQHQQAGLTPPSTLPPEQQEQASGASIT
jgi:hypothetical protein